ncbi:MAG: TFIIB-type zinc ribbon-containing protein [Salinirussus sp.]
MEIRGDRECRDCGTRWSYFETGSVACPSCGSVISTGQGDRAEHTAGGVALDLSEARSAIDEKPLPQVADLAADAGRAYRRAAGFIDAGTIAPLDDTYLIAVELQTVGAEVRRSMRLEDAVTEYLIALLRAPLEDDRPGPATVPEGLTSARGLAVCSAVDDYLSDLRRVVDTAAEPLARPTSRLRAHRKRIEALDGDVDPRVAERLVGATRDLYAFLERDDEAALARIDERLRIE